MVYGLIGLAISLKAVKTVADKSKKTAKQFKVSKKQTKKFKVSKKTKKRFTL